MRSLILSLSLLVSFSATAAVYVLDAGAKSMVRLDVQHGSIEAKVPLPFIDDPTEIVATPDGKRLVVLSRTSAAIVDTATFSVSPRMSCAGDQFDVVSNDVGVVFRKGLRYTNPRVSFVSLDSFNVITTVDLTGKAAELVNVPGSGYIYAIESNAVDVISIADRKLVATMSVGNNAKLGGVDEETRSLYVIASDD